MLINSIIYLFEMSHLKLQWCYKRRRLHKTAGGPVRSGRRKNNETVSKELMNKLL